MHDCERAAALEHFIPLRKADLVRMLREDAALPVQEREQFDQFCELVAATIHHDYHGRLEDLKEAYASFDPDADPRPRVEATPTEREELAGELFTRFESLLERANYRRLSRQDLEQALRATSVGGVNLSVDFKIFERLEVFVRGESTGCRTRRRWRKFLRSEDVPVPTYERLALIFRLRSGSGAAQKLDANSVALKLFKSIPKEDVEMLLPGSQVRMTLLDRGRILLPTVSGLTLTAVKLLQGAATLALATVNELLGFLGLIGGAIGYGIKSFFGYLRTKDKYTLTLTRSLYYQNLDNNAGVLFRLLDEAEEQEFREAVLAWSLLHRNGSRGATEQELDQHAEGWLRERCSLTVDFEVGDALGKLERMNLAHRSANRWHAVSLPAALETLDRAWDECFAYNKPTVLPLRRAA